MTAIDLEVNEEQHSSSQNPQEDGAVSSSEYHHVNPEQYCYGNDECLEPQLYLHEYQQDHDHMGQFHDHHDQFFQDPDHCLQ